jgi:16S rRNA (adenine1518-N6/adenine1519-N6)-dimethyltransferase
VNRRPFPGQPRSRRRFGQHFLAPAWARKVVAAIAPAPGDVFLEIGPGTGALTLPLAESGVPILAIDIDRDLVRDLAARVPPNVTVIAGDVLQTNVMALVRGMAPTRPPGEETGCDPGFHLNPVSHPVSHRRYRVVGNLPYNVATPILFRLIELHRHDAGLADATVMVQREVADRVLARPGRKEYGTLSIFSQLHARVSRLLDLPPGAFVPMPKVRSTVIRLAFAPPAIRIADDDLFVELVRTIFGQRRKTLRNGLKSLGAPADAVLTAAGIDPRRRAETLELAELARLADAVAAARRHLL